MSEATSRTQRDPSKAQKLIIDINGDFGTEVMERLKCILQRILDSTKRLNLMGFHWTSNYCCRVTSADVERVFQDTCISLEF